MNVSEVINFKIDLEKGSYISAIELIEIVESFNEGIEPKDLVNFLETLNIFSMRLYSFNEYNGLIYYGHPDFDKKIGKKIADFLYLRENHVKDGTHDVYASRLSHLETVCWHRVDLLRVEGFVDNTDIVNWGKKHILQRIYNDMTGEHFDVITSFTKNAQQNIFKILGRTPLDNNTSGHTQAQIAQLATNNEKAQAKIAELKKQLEQAISDNDNIKKQLEQAHADNDLLRKEIEDNKELEPSSIAAVTRLLNVLFYKADYEISAHSGTLNKQLIEYSKHPSVNTSISKGFLTPWLKRVQQLRIETKTGSHDRHAPL